ncbi:RICIN domain-containing protein [Actinomycetes bacterium KLBMP 9797]
MGNTRKIVAKIMAVGLGMVAALAITSPAKADPETGPYLLASASSLGELCLAIGGSNPNNNAPAVQWKCAGDNYDKWWIFDQAGTHDGAKVYRLRNVSSQKCLAIGEGSTANSAGAIQFTCGSGAEQRWKYDSDFRLRNMKSDKCLAIPGGSNELYIQAIQYTCKEASLNQEQVWYNYIIP